MIAQVGGRGGDGSGKTVSAPPLGRPTTRPSGDAVTCAGVRQPARQRRCLRIGRARPRHRLHRRAAGDGGAEAVKRRCGGRVRRRIERSCWRHRVLMCVGWQFCGSGSRRIAPAGDPPLQPRSGPQGRFPPCSAIAAIAAMCGDRGPSPTRTHRFTWPALADDRRRHGIHHEGAPMRTANERLYPYRYTALGLCALALLGTAAGWVWLDISVLWPVLFALLVALGIYDLSQKHHAVLRNYPVIGHLRFLLEFIRPGDPPVLHRERHRGRAVLARAALARLPARQGRARQAAVRHAARRGARRLRVDQPFAAADAARHRTTSAISRSAQRRAHAALQRQRLQHLGDELRLAVGATRSWR